MALNLSSALEHDLFELAAASHVTADALAEDLLARFVLEQRDLNEAVQRGRDDIAAGRVHSQEEVEAYIYGLLGQL